VFVDSKQGRDGLTIGSLRMNDRPCVNVGAPIRLALVIVALFTRDGAITGADICVNAQSSRFSRAGSLLD